MTCIIYALLWYCPLTRMTSQTRKMIYGTIIHKVTVWSRSSREESAGGKNVSVILQSASELDGVVSHHLILRMVQVSECCSTHRISDLEHGCFCLNVRMNATSSVFPVVAMIYPCAKARSELGKQCGNGGLSRHNQIFMKLGGGMLSRRMRLLIFINKPTKLAGLATTATEWDEIPRDCPI